jgi:RNA polymerase sigma-70 factor, ECF subfamily
LPRRDEKYNIQTSELDLIKRAASGDRGSFDVLFHRYEKRVMALAFRLTGDPDLAADVTQEVFIRVHRSLNGFHQEKRFFTWLYKITVNASIDMIKKFKKTREVPIENANLEHLQTVDTSGTDPDGTAEAIWSIVQDLSPPQRTAFILREADDLPCREIAAIMGCTAGTVRSHLHYARIRLRNEIRIRYPDLLNRKKS